MAHAALPQLAQNLVAGNRWPFDGYAGIENHVAGRGDHVSAGSMKVGGMDGGRIARGRLEPLQLGGVLRKALRKGGDARIFSLLPAQAKLRLDQLKSIGPCRGKHWIHVQISFGRNWLTRAPTLLLVDQ